MASLFVGVSTAMQGLLTAQGELNTTSNNISNVNTPGYTRERAILSEQLPIQMGQLEFGTGVDLERIESVRDSVLEYRIGEETQRQSQLQAYLDPMQQVESAFNETQGAGLQLAITALFSSFSALSANPTSMPLRQGVLSAAEQLANAFNGAANMLSSTRANIDQDVSSTASEIDSLTQQIAKLNAQIGQVGSSGDTNVLQDKRMALIQQLSGDLNVSVIDAGDGTLTLTTGNGSALVVGQQSMDLTVQRDSSTGTQHVFAQGQDITAISGGKLGGLVQARDQDLARLSSQLDQLAANLSDSINSVHAAGFGLNGTTGQNLFTTPPAGGTGAALAMAVAIDDPAQVAASADGMSGDNQTAAALAQLESQPIVNGQTPVDFYANTVSQLGSAISDANSELDAQNLALQQLNQQRNSISGVSLDEEAANLVKFQQAYQAAAHVVSVLDGLTAVALNLAGGQTVS